MFIVVNSATEESGADYALFAGFVGTYSTSNNLQNWLLTDADGDTEVEGTVADSSLTEIDGMFTLLDVDAPFTLPPSALPTKRPTQSPTDKPTMSPSDKPTQSKYKLQ